MSRILYLDCFSGISGDMVLGAFLDAGLPLDGLKNALGSLALPRFDVSLTRVLRAGVSATKFGVHDNHMPPVATQESGERHRSSVASRRANAEIDEHGDRPHPHRHDEGHDHQHDLADEPQHDVHDDGHPHTRLADIYAAIDRSALSLAGRSQARAMFHRLAEAEAAIHQMSVDEVHLHEVGALDSIIDIVGTVYAMEWVAADRIVCSPLNLGGGMVQSAHGLFPVPAPATVRLLGEAPVYSGSVQKELVTPTGALIATTYAAAFGPIPAMAIEHVGYGAGERDNPGTPNVLRLLIGRATDQPSTERVTVIECEIDDMNPQIFGVAMDQLYAAGALEVFYIPVQMKKNRPGILLTVITPPERRTALAEVIFRETTTIGVRYFDVERECLRRELVTVDTPVGAVRFKLAWRDGQIVNAVPEFDDCARLAAANNLSVKAVQALAVQAYGLSGSRQS